MSNMKGHDIAVAIEQSVYDIDSVYHPAIARQWCDSEVSGHLTFYMIVIERGVGFPLHPFFVDILDFTISPLPNLLPYPGCICWRLSSSIVRGIGCLKRHRVEKCLQIASLLQGGEIILLHQVAGRRVSIGGEGAE